MRELQIVQDKDTGHKWVVLELDSTLTLGFFVLAARLHDGYIQVFYLDGEWNTFANLHTCDMNGRIVRTHPVYWNFDLVVGYFTTMQNKVRAVELYQQFHNEGIRREHGLHADHTTQWRLRQ